MALSTLSFSTGPSTLPDIGELSYNGCVFSPLFETHVSGVAVKDDAQRTTKFMEYTITVDGYVTLPSVDTSIAPTMVILRDRLSAQGGVLVYRGRGCDISVNPAGGLGVTSRQRDVAWGPVPDVLEFQPLGGGLSAKVKWQVKTRIPETTGRIGTIGVGGLAAIPLLQFNYETVVSYGEDGFSTTSTSGTVEIALTRPTQRTRNVSNTVDSVRSVVEARLMNSTDLSRFRITRREFNVSRDKRTMTWSFTAEEKPYMDLPPDCTIARGQYTVRPAKAGMGLVLWLCTLRATYTVRADRPRRTAWLMFLALLRHRMAESHRSFVPALDGPPVGPPPGRPVPSGLAAIPSLTTVLAAMRIILSSDRATVRDSRRAWLMEFSFDEGVYLDSKTVSFSATWRLVTALSHVLLASGLWKKVPEASASGNLWATSMRNVSGSTSWLTNRVNPALDIIVDFGGAFGGGS